tara:strand:- start:1048 stop:2220 length:1173 start_codon:yes stop_codon:yes gene_type:complete
MSKYTQYTDEVKSIREDTGYGSDRIAQMLSSKYPNDDIVVSTFGRWIRKNDIISPSIVDESMHRNNLNPSDNWKLSWVKDKVTGTSTLVVNPDYKNAESVDYEQIRTEMMDEMKKLSPKVNRYKRKKTKDPHCLVLDIADLHIGKLATMDGANDTYNVDIAIERAIKGSLSLIDKSKPYNIEKIFFIIGNDVLHIDNAKTRTTTSGTPQDTDGMWYDNFKIARGVYCHIINMLSTISDVHVIHCPSNHDYMTGFMLADAVNCYFHNNKNITFDVSNVHRKYVKYGKNLLNFSHGDGAKIDKIPYLAAHEVPQLWADTMYRYAFMHHIHHKQYYKFMSGADFIGMTVEYLRSPSGSDRWHNDNGYTGSKVCIEAFIHHPDNGQVCRLTHNF